MSQQELDKTTTLCYNDLSKGQKDLLDFCIEVGHGTFEVTVQDGQPVLAKKAIQKRKLG